MPLTAPRHLVPPVPLLAGPQVRLFLVSATLLFVELLVIRWIPANVIYVGYFSNFLLISSFLGIGLGILLGRARPTLPVSPFAPLLRTAEIIHVGKGTTFLMRLPMRKVTGSKQ